MFADAVAPGDMVGPAQVVLEYMLPYESFTKYSTSATDTLPALLNVAVMFVGELTWTESKAMRSPGVKVGPQPVLRQARVCEDSAYKTRPNVRTMITTTRTLPSAQLNR